MARKTKRTRSKTPRQTEYLHHSSRQRLADPLTRDYWPKLHLAPLKRYIVKSYIPNPTINPALRAGLEWNKSRLRRAGSANSKVRASSGMHDTPFKRPSIAPYGAWTKGIGYLVPLSVKTCVQRKQRREAVFAQTGGGSIRRKSTNRRTPQSQIRCK